MHFGLLLLIAATLNFSTDVLILKSGDRIAVSGPIREVDKRLVFRSESGALYSIPTSDVDLEATRAAASEPMVVSADGPKKLKVSAEERKRLLKELEQNHSGKPATAAQLALPPVQPLPPAIESERPPGDEWNWKYRVRAHEEALTRARENLSLLHERIEALQSQITGFISLGYKPQQFTYQSSQLQLAIDQIPYAELQVTRAERSLAQFRDDARRQGVPPGWLR